MKTLASIALAIGLILASWVRPCSAVEDQSPFGGRATPDPRVHDYILPARVLWQSPPEGCTVLDAELLVQPFRDQVTLGNRSGCSLRNYGKQADGRIKSDIQAPPGVKIER